MYLIFVQRLRTIVQTVDILIELLGVLNLCTKVTDNCTICHSSLNTTCTIIQFTVGFVVYSK